MVIYNNFMSKIKLYTFSTTKKQYFYINQKVKDIQTGQEGIIYNISSNLSNEIIIKVSYIHFRKGYPSNQQIYLETI